MKKFPKELLVYVCDYENDGTPIYAVAEGVDEIPDDLAEHKVGAYSLNRTWEFVVRRELK